LSDSSERGNKKSQTILSLGDEETEKGRADVKKKTRGKGIFSSLSILFLVVLSFLLSGSLFQKFFF